MPDVNELKSMEDRAFLDMMDWALFYWKDDPEWFADPDRPWNRECLTSMN
jgi:hypothetical protein